MDKRMVGLLSAKKEKSLYNTADTWMNMRTRQMLTTKCIIFVLLGHLLIVLIPSNCKMTITTYYLTLNDIDGYFF